MHPVSAYTGASSSPTTGGTVVVVGRNFGPASLNAVDRVEYVHQHLPLEYQANCTVTVDDVQLTCRTPGGVGADLLWTVTIAGQSSSNPRTGYHPPQVHSVGVGVAVGMPVGDQSSDLDRSSSDGTSGEGDPSASPATTRTPPAALAANVTLSPSVLASLPTSGGGLALVLTGKYFAGRAVAAPLSVIARGSGEHGPARVAAPGCAVSQEEVEVTCMVPPGVGTNFSWSVCVAGQCSPPTPGAVTSYGAPTVTRVDVSDSGPGSTAPATGTAGGATITLLGTNLGSDPRDVTVTWNGEEVTSVFYPVPHSQLRFSTIPGPGGPIVLTLSVGGQTPGVGTLPRNLSYRGPSISAVDVDSDHQEDVDCSSGPVSVGAANATLVVYGANFGVPGAATVLVNGVPCAVDPLRASPAHDELYFVTPLCSGVVTVVVAGVRSGTVAYVYQDLVASPVVVTVSPLVLTGPTLGGTSITISGRYFQSRGTVVFVGVGECDWRSGLANGTTYYTRAEIRCVGRVWWRVDYSGCVCHLSCSLCKVIYVGFL